MLLAQFHVKPRIATLLFNLRDSMKKEAFGGHCGKQAARLDGASCVPRGANSLGWGSLN